MLLNLNKLICILFITFGSFNFCFAQINNQDSIKQVLVKTNTNLEKAAILASFNINDTQAQNEDSLKDILTKTHDDSSKATILIQLAVATNIFNREKSINYYLEALKYEKRKHNRALILDKVGLYNWQLGNFPIALDYLQKSSVLFNELQDTTWLGKVNNNLAVVNWELGNSNKALEYYLIALKMRQSLKDMKGVATILNNIGLIYQGWGLYDEAFKWHKDALNIAQNLEILDALTYTYSSLGQCYENTNDFKTALKYYKLGYEIILKDPGENHSAPFFLTIIGSAYSNIGELDSAIIFHKRSLDYAKRINSKNRIAVAEYYLGKTYLMTNKVDIAYKYIFDSYEHSKQNKYFGLIKDCQFVLSEIEEKKGNISKAFEYFKSASALKDSTFNKENVKKFTELQVKYYLEKKTQENDILRKNNEIQELTIHSQNDLRNILIFSGLFILTFLLIIAKSRASLKKMNIKLKLSEQDLLESNSSKDKFFSIISHDLKSPFGSILSASELLVSDYDQLTTYEIKEMLQILRESSANIYELLDGLLQWATTQTNRMEYEFEKIDLSENCFKVIELLNPSAQKKNISLESRIKENTFVFADNKATSTILRNLISNAIKFTSIGGEIIIAAENNENGVLVSITDSGIGMNEENKNKLFRIDVHHTTVGTNNETGTGLGLVLCKELVEKQGGKIWVESQLGKGSTFTFNLPKIK